MTNITGQIAFKQYLNMSLTKKKKKKLFNTNIVDKRTIIFAKWILISTFWILKCGETIFFQIDVFQQLAANLIEYLSSCTLSLSLFFSCCSSAINCIHCVCVCARACTFFENSSIVSPFSLHPSTQRLERA